jgi:hypothetical protein
VFEGTETVLGIENSTDRRLLAPVAPLTEDAGTVKLGPALFTAGASVTVTLEGETVFVLGGKLVPVTVTDDGGSADGGFAGEFNVTP